MHAKCVEDCCGAKRIIAGARSQPVIIAANAKRIAIAVASRKAKIIPKTKCFKILLEGM